MRFVRGILCDDRKNHFARMKICEALRPGNQFAVWRENRRDAHQVLRSNAGIAQGELKGSQPLAVLSLSLREKDPLGDHVLAQFICLQQVKVTREAKI